MLNLVYTVLVIILGVLIACAGLAMYALVLLLKYIYKDMERVNDNDK